MENLTKTEAYLISDILGECLKKIQIIGEISLSSKSYISQNEASQKKNRYDEIDIMYSDEENKLLYHCREINPEEKLINDRDAIETALMDTIKEIRVNSSYENLKKFNQNYYESRKKIDDIYNNCAKQKQDIFKMKKTADKEKKDMQQELVDMDEHINELSFELQKIKLKANTEKEYVTKECANDITRTVNLCKMEEADMERKVELLQQRHESEGKISKDITHYWKEKELDLLGQLDYWKFKFYDEQMKKERELRTLKKYKSFHKNKLEDVNIALEEDKKFLDKQEKIKYDERERIKELKKKVAAAIPIQAWWRGTMVRRQLGPYAPEPEVKQKKKEKKEKKEKKKEKK